MAFAYLLIAYHRQLWLRLAELNANTSNCFQSAVMDLCWPLNPCSFLITTHSQGMLTCMLRITYNFDYDGLVLDLERHILYVGSWWSTGSCALANVLIQKKWCDHEYWVITHIPITCGTLSYLLYACFKCNGWHRWCLWNNTSSAYTWFYTVYRY